MATDPRANDPLPNASDPDDPDRRPPWVAPLAGLVVLAVLVVAGRAVWRFMQGPETAAKPAAAPVAPAGPGRPMFTFGGTVSRTGKDGQKEVVKDATVVVLQPAWMDEQQQEWERRVNAMVAKAWGELGAGEAPPTVTADPVSVRKADEAMARRQQAAKSGAPWKHRCTSEFLALLKESGIEVKRGATGADGAYSMTTVPPAGIPYIVHGTSAEGEWLDKLNGRNRLDLDDGNRVPD